MNKTFQYDWTCKYLFLLLGHQTVQRAPAFILLFVKFINDNTNQKIERKKAEIQNNLLSLT